MPEPFIKDYATRGEIELALMAARDLPPERYFAPGRDQWIRALETAQNALADRDRLHALVRELTNRLTAPAARLTDPASSSGSCGCRKS